MSERPGTEFAGTGLSPLERALQVFTEVRAGEGRTALLMLANVLLILCTYYLVKPVREGWLAVSGVEGLTKMELKAYSSFAQGLLLIAVTALYARRVTRLPPVTLITNMTVFCLANLLLFWALQPGVFFGLVPVVGIVFYLWVGIFGLFAIAQFWSVAADIYDDEQGRRLIPLIAIGATSGAVVGSWIAETLVKSGLVSAEHLLLVSLVPLSATIWLTRAAGRSTDHRAPGSRSSDPEREAGRGALGLVLGSRFLLAVAVLTLLFNWVGTNGENVLFQVVQDVLEDDAQEAGLAAGYETLRFMRDGTAAFYGGFFFWVNLVALVAQSFLASRLLRYGGFGAVFLLLPVIALASYAVMFLVPVLVVIKVMKVAENATDYSINNTSRQVLWLPIGSDVIYRAKPAIDSLFVRLGDGLAALTVLLGTRLILLPLEGYLGFNVSLVLVWLVLGVWIVRRHARICRERGVDVAG